MSLFDTLRPEQIISEPYPHIVVRDLLDKRIVDRLIEERPSLEHIIGDSDAYQSKKYHYCSKKALNDPQMSQSWKDLINEHLQPETIRKFLRLFAQPIAQKYPELLKRYGSIEEWSIGKRYQDEAKDHTILADAQFTYHMPVPGDFHQERGPHIRITNKILICVFLLRLPEDKDAGGEIELYTTVDGQKVEYGRDQQIITPNAIKLVKTIPYEANTAILFLNSARSVTTYAKRGNNTHPYMYFNVILEFEKPIFKLLNKFENENSGFYRIQRGLQRLFS